MAKKTWIINVQVNTQYMNSIAGTGTWEAPIGAGQYWLDNVRMAAVSDNPADGIIVGKGDDFTLTVGKDDTIKWIVSEVDPTYLNYRSVCMYGFKQGSNWDSNLMPPSTEVAEAGFVAMLNGFNAEHAPQGKYIECTQADISIPKTTVRASAQSCSIQYYMKFLLVDIEDSSNPRVLKYLQVDPTIRIVK